MYITVGVPSSRTVADPVVGVDTREDQIEALRILSAGNTIIIVLLGAVLTLQVRCCPCAIQMWNIGLNVLTFYLSPSDTRDVLMQAGEEYARRAEAKENARLASTLVAEEPIAKEERAESKKNQ